MGPEQSVREMGQGRVRTPPLKKAQELLATANDRGEQRLITARLKEKRASSKP